MSPKPWGEPYGGERDWLTPEGVTLTMRRRGCRVRFYDDAGNQIGPEHANVYPAMVAAFAAGYRDLSAPRWLSDGCAAEVKRRSHTP